MGWNKFGARERETDPPPPPQTERLWRKNRSPTSIAWCRGVDLNRNFDVNFGGPGASEMSCSEVYSGSNAFSESESQAIARYVVDSRDLSTTDVKIVHQSCFAKT